MGKLLATSRFHELGEAVPLPLGGLRFREAGSERGHFLGYFVPLLGEGVGDRLGHHLPLEGKAQRQLPEVEVVLDARVELAVASMACSFSATVVSRG